MPAPYDTDTTADELVNDYNNLIKNKVVLTTGVSSGSLGGFFVQSIAKAKPAWLILAARNTDKLQQVANDITAAYPEVKVRTVKVDLGSLKSVRDAAAQVNSWDDIPVIDVMVNNAGIMAVDYQLSPEEFESHLATNHLGPFLFTNLIIKKILASKSPRIVMVSSDGHRMSPFRFDDYNFDVSDVYDLAFCEAPVLRYRPGREELQQMVRLWPEQNSQYIVCNVSGGEARPETWPSRIQPAPGRHLDKSGQPPGLECGSGWNS